MTRPSKKHLLAPLLVAAVALAVTASAPSQASARSSASLQINFGTQPHWDYVQGTRVRVISDQDRPDYDVFAYGGRYYVYRDDGWYMSRRPHGRYMMIDERSVPREFTRVPRERWRHYPGQWQGRGYDRNRGHDDNGQHRGDDNGQNHGDRYHG